MPDRLSHEIVGVIHIHSRYSDGTKAIEEIAKIGEAAGLDFLMFSDHMTLQPLLDGHQRFHGKVAALIGYEIEDGKNENHYLAFDIENELPPDLSAVEYVRELKRRGGLGIIAHPDEIRNAIPRYPSYPWTAWDADGFDAIEIWNHMSAWMELLKRINALKMLVTPRRGLRGPTERVLKKWDDLSRHGRVAGVGSADVHAHAYRSGPIRVTIFPYKVQFRSIRTHLLLPQELSPDFGAAKNQIVAAIKNCRAFVSNYRWGDARGFRFYVRDGERVFELGDDVPFSKDQRLVMAAPRRANIRIIKNGALDLALKGNSFDIPLRSRGLYRVELLRRGKGWIYSNHIRVL